MFQDMTLAVEVSQAVLSVFSMHWTIRSHVACNLDYSINRLGLQQHDSTKV